jgi:hypothetical protein
LAAAVRVVVAHQATGRNSRPFILRRRVWKIN